MSNLQKYGAKGDIALSDAQWGEHPTSSVVFSEKVESWEDFISQVDPSSMNDFTINAGVDSPPGAVKRFGALFQKRIVWRVTIDAVTLYTLLRPLARRSDGKFAPSGDWTQEKKDVYRFVGRPTKRHGAIPSTYRDGQNDDAVDDVTPLPGDLALNKLPSVVQKFAHHHVPMPTYSHGGVFQHSEGHLPSKHSVDYIRMDEGKVIVIHADKVFEGGLRSASEEEAQLAIARQPWVVTQTFGQIREYHVGSQVQVR